MLKRMKRAVFGCSREWWISLVFGSFDIELYESGNTRWIQSYLSGSLMLRVSSWQTVGEEFFSLFCYCTNPVVAIASEAQKGWVATFIVQQKLRMHGNPFLICPLDPQVLALVSSMSFTMRYSRPQWWDMNCWHDCCSICIYIPIEPIIWPLLW